MSHLFAKFFISFATKKLTATVKGGVFFFKKKVGKGMGFMLAFGGRPRLAQVAAVITIQISSGASIAAGCIVYLSTVKPIPFTVRLSAEPFFSSSAPSERTLPSSDPPQWNALLSLSPTISELKPNRWHGSQVANETLCTHPVNGGNGNSVFAFFSWEPAKGKLHRSVINRLLPSLQCEVPRRVLKTFFFPKMPLFDDTSSKDEIIAELVKKFDAVRVLFPTCS